MPPTIGGDGHAAIAGTPDDPFRPRPQASPLRSSFMATDYGAGVSIPDNTLTFLSQAIGTGATGILYDPSSLRGVGAYVSTYEGATLATNTYLRLPEGQWWWQTYTHWDNNATGDREVGLDIGDNRMLAGSGLFDPFFSAPTNITLLQNQQVQQNASLITLSTSGTSRIQVNSGMIVITDQMIHYGDPVNGGPGPVVVTPFAFQTSGAPRTITGIQITLYRMNNYDS